MNDKEQLDWIETYLINGGELTFWFCQNYFRIQDSGDQTIAKEITIRAAIDAARKAT